MNHRFSAWLRAGVAALALLATGVAAATTTPADQNPVQLVNDTTSRVIALAKDARGYYDKDPGKLNQQVEAVMDDVVDFKGFARGVMGSYASALRYRALKTDAERTAFKARIDRFADIFRKALVATYAKGLLKFDGQRIETVPSRSRVSGSFATVVQNIYGNADKPYVVQYSLHKDRQGDWKLSNVIIEGVNLGQTYRNQFASAAEQYHGDLDKVIDHWQVAPDTKSDDAQAGAQ